MLFSFDINKMLLTIILFNLFVSLYIYQENRETKGFIH
jgi:hypothetical protein